MTVAADNPLNGRGEATMARVTEYDNVGMSAINRCDRCIAQAYVEVLMNSGALLFCAKHATENWEALLKIEDAEILDHRPFLYAQEQSAESTKANRR